LCIVLPCWQWQKMAKTCFQGSFHHNPRTWFDWLLTKGKRIILSVQSVRNRAQMVRLTWQGEILRTRTSNLLTQALVEFYVTHRNEKLSQWWWWPWQKKGYFCFHGSFHRNPRTRFGWLLTEDNSYQYSLWGIEAKRAGREPPSSIFWCALRNLDGCSPVL
jgi:hypothetical protein